MAIENLITEFMIGAIGFAFREIWEYVGEYMHWFEKRECAKNAKGSSK